MKTTTQWFVIAALVFAAPLASAAIYEGSWKNKTFDSTGALTLDLNITKSKVTGSLDLDGPVFGGGDPPAIPFNFSRKKNGSGSIKILGSSLGDITGTFNSNGKLDFKITNIPGGFLTEARLDGKFDLKLEKFKATYEIDNADGLYAEGSAAAHVHKAPVVKAPGIVTVNGKTGEVTVKVVSNTKITGFTATADGGAKVTVVGKNPYHISVKKMTLPTTRLTIVVSNADGLETTEVVKFVKRKPAAWLLGGRG